MALDPESPEVRDAVFGKQIELFMDSDIGKYLQEGMKTLADVALIELKDADPFEPKKIVQLQERVRIFENMASLLAEAIIKGQNALQLLEEEHV